MKLPENFNKREIIFPAVAFVLLSLIARFSQAAPVLRELVHRRNQRQTDGEHGATQPGDKSMPVSVPGCSTSNTPAGP